MQGSGWSSGRSASNPCEIATEPEARLLVLARSEVEALLDPDALVDALAEALRELSEGRASMPPRVAARVERRGGLLGVMPVYLPSASVLSAKLVSVFPGNAALGLDTHRALIAAFDEDTGAPLALMDGTHITAARTAAGSALATRLLAREDSDTVAILGTGVQARAHARAIRRVRPVRAVRVWGRRHERARALAAELAAELGLEARAEASPPAAMEGAGIVCAATHSAEPVVAGRDLAAGTHVNSVGFNPEGREVDAEAVAAAAVFVESRASALADPPAGCNDLLWPIRDGLIGPGHVRGEIGELVAGTCEGRRSAAEVTLYKSVGVAVQDAAAVRLVLEAARRRGVGRELEI